MFRSSRDLALYQSINTIFFFTISRTGAVHLAGPIAKITKGLCKLCLSHCGLTSKGINQIAHSLSLNQSISSSLTYLDLSGNNLKDDITVSSLIDEDYNIMLVFWG